MMEVLCNDETSSDDELVNLFFKKFKVPYRDAAKLVKLRSKIIGRLFVTDGHGSYKEYKPTLKNPAQDTEITKVIFRKWKVQGDIIAIFPELSYRQNYRTQMYQHVGQHGEGDYQHVVSATVPAKPSEYADLKRELEGIGYKLKVVKRAKITWK
jgi:hypothetical protein